MTGRETCNVWEVSMETCDRDGYHVFTVGPTRLVLCGEHARKWLCGAYGNSAARRTP